MASTALDDYFFNMVLVTAANSRYFTGLANLVGSLHYWSPATQIAIYDLGLKTPEIDELHKWRNTSLTTNFLKHDLPPHCQQVNTYAWKPLVLHDAIKRYTSILYLDAGSEIRARMNGIKKSFERDCHLFVQGQDLDMTRKSHSSMFLEMGTSKTEFIGKPSYAGSLQGYQRHSQAHQHILLPLYNYALNAKCIAPAGSSLANHRYDQSVLSGLIYRCGFNVSARTELICADRSKLNSDPLKTNRFEVYSARGSSIDYINQVRKIDGEICYPILTG